MIVKDEGDYTLILEEGDCGRYEFTIWYDGKLVEGGEKDSTQECMDEFHTYTEYEE